MTDSPYQAMVDVTALSGPQRAHLDQSLRAEGIAAQWTGDALYVDHAFEPRVSSLVESARYAGPDTASAATSPPPYPAPYPASGYPTSPTAYAPSPPNNSNAVLALVFGIIGLVACPIFAIAAIVMGRKAQHEIAASNGTEGGEGLARAGVVMGWIEVALIAFSVAIVVLVVVIAAVGRGT